MEQLPDVCLRRRGIGKSGLSGMAAQDNVFRLADPLIRNPRMSGAPRPDVSANSKVSGEDYGLELKAPHLDGYFAKFRPFGSCKRGFAPALRFIIPRVHC